MSESCAVSKMSSKESNLEELDANDAEHELKKQGDHYNVLN